MFADKRSMKVVLVAHCVLNQNAKVDRCAHYPGAIKPVARVLLESGIGLVQMPCPELACLGLDRQAPRGTNPSVEEEDTRIAGRMVEKQSLAASGELAAHLVYEVQEYHRHGFTVIGVLGINGSPTCGVETTWQDGKERAGRGVFLDLLWHELERRGISIAMRGIKAYEPEQAVRVVQELVGK